MGRPASELGLRPDAVVERVRALARVVPDAFEHAVRDPHLARVASDLPPRLTDLVSARAEHCIAVLE